MVGCTGFSFAHLTNKVLPCGNGTDTVPLISDEYLFNVNLPPPPIMTHDDT